MVPIYVENGSYKIMEDHRPIGPFLDLQTFFWGQHFWVINWLVVWNIWLIFPYVGNFTIPTDELIFFRGVGLNHQPDKHRYYQTNTLTHLTLTGWCPPVISWFINPMNTIVISTINHSEMGVMFTNLANYGAPPCSHCWCSFTWEPHMVICRRIVI